jgi:mono/diheme cytochrome c family protein
MKNPISKIAVPILCLFAIATVANLPARAQSAAEKTFKAKCVACHGADGPAPKRAKNLAPTIFVQRTCKK